MSKNTVDTWIVTEVANGWIVTPANNLRDGFVRPNEDTYVFTTTEEVGEFLTEHAIHFV